MNNIRNTNNTHFDEWAPKYELSKVQKYFFDPIHRRMIKLLLDSDIKSPSNILDIGCGTGRLLRNISKLFPDAYLTGVDISDSMIKSAREIKANSVSESYAYQLLKPFIHLFDSCVVIFITAKPCSLALDAYIKKLISQCYLGLQIKKV